MPPRLTDAAGWPVRLDRQLASGGEGTIWIHGDRPDRVAKIYHHPLPDDDADKLRALTGRAVPALIDRTGWPTELLFRSGLVAGFLMPRFIGVVPIQQLYNPARRRRHFPRADWAFLVRTARLCAELFDAIHQAGCVIADVNQSNLLVASDGRVVLVDCDSFQVHDAGRVFACHVGVTDYTPPELQGRDFPNLLRTENHDAFGLAVLIFQILVQGRHPFAGIWRGEGEMPIERAIADGRFAYGGGAASMRVDRPPHALALDDLSTEVAALFERAFGRFERRPTPREWARALDAMAGNLQPCANQPGHLHLAAKTRCPWCAIMRHGGPDYFADASPAPATFAVDRAAIDALNERIEREPLDAFGYDRARLAPAASPRPLPSSAAQPDALAPSLLAVAVFGLTYSVAALGLPSAFTIGLPLALVGGAGWLMRSSRSPRWRERRIRRQGVRDAEGALLSLEREWREAETGLVHRARELQSQLRREIAEARALDSQFRSEVRRLGEHRSAQVCTRFLQTQFVGKALIPGLSTNQIQMLAAFGVETAFDVEEWRVRPIRGLSKKLVQALLDWKRDLTAKYRSESTRNVPEEDLQPLAIEFQRKHKQTIERLTAGTAELELLGAEIRATFPQLGARLRPLVAQWQQATADYSVFRKGIN